jgi:hypothetical protein
MPELEDEKGVPKTETGEDVEEVPEAKARLALQQPRQQRRSRRCLSFQHRELTVGRKELRERRVRKTCIVHKAGPSYVMRHIQNSS